MRKTLAAIVVLATAVSFADDAKKAPQGKLFYVYHDFRAPENHYIPSGWMGSYGDLKLNENETEEPYDGKSAMSWTYNAKDAQGAGWAGVFWQIPANNWGEKPGGFDLTGFKRLTFYAKADRAVKIADFKVGGITGQYGDSDSTGLSGVDVGKTWKKYTIELADKNLSHIVGAFCFSASRDDNPDGFRLFLDEIRFER